jgi:short-subunit dehydrogenase
MAEPKRKHAFITGASSGIGDALAREYARQGWDLTLVARRVERLEALAKELDTKVLVLPADLSDWKHCADLISRAEAGLGTVDALINNAGVQYVERASGVSPERLDMLWGLNVMTPMHLMHTVLGPMEARGAGYIVNVASMAGIIPTPGMCHYNGTKAGLAAMSESLRVEVGPKGVHVLTVYPGPVESEMDAAARRKYDASMAARNAPTGTPDVLAQRVYRAMIRRDDRVVYPAVYGLARYARITSQWFTDTFTPSLREE